MPQAVYFWKQGCACLPPFPYTPLSLCAAVVVLVSCRFQAAEQQLQSAQTFPYILIHFYCHAHEHTAPFNSKNQQPTGRWKFFFPFPSLLGKKTGKKGKTFSAQWIFAHFPPVWAGPAPSPCPTAPFSCRKSIRCACRLPDCEKFPFSILHFPLCCSCSKSHRARLTMQIAGKYLGLWLGKLRWGEGEG